jgi:hypothetical protein
MVVVGTTTTGALVGASVVAAFPVLREAVGSGCRHGHSWYYLSRPGGTVTLMQNQPEPGAKLAGISIGSATANASDSL